MAKVIIYTAVESGMDGRGKARNVFASYSEKERDTWFEQSKNKNFYRKDEGIFETEKTQSSALAKLDAVDRLSLGINPDVSIKKISVKKHVNTLRNKG